MHYTFFKIMVTFSEEHENMNLKRNMHPNVHCSIIHYSQEMKATKHPSIDEWIKKMWYIYLMESYSAIKKIKSCHL